MTKRPSTSLLHTAVALLTVGACDTQSEGESPTTAPAELRSGGFSCGSASPIPTHDIDVTFGPSGATSTTLIETSICPVPPLQLSGNPPVVSKRIADILTTAAPTEMVPNVVFSCESEVAPPVLPRFDPGQPRTSRDNQSVGASRQQLMERFRVRRAVEQDWLISAIKEGDGRVRLQQGLGSLVVADVPAGTLATLVQDSRLHSIGSWAAPPDVTPGGNARSMLSARQQMNSAAAFAAGFTGDSYHVGVVDSGVTEHELLSGQLGIEADCTALSGLQCVGKDPTDCSPHGTSVSAIIAATDVYGTEDRGVTSATIDSWKTSSVGLEGNCQRQPDFVAAGFENAVQNDDVINASFGFSFTPGYTAEPLQIESIANDAFVTGAVVIAATGNIGDDPESATAPGTAPNVIGVGAVTESGSVPNYSGRGPSYIGGRVKPDLLGPTDVTTACSSSPSCGSDFGGTSAASPMVAGVATQVLDIFDSVGGFDTIDPQLVPGSVYSTLIGFGTPLSGGAAAGSFNNTEGVGLLELGKTSCARWRWGTMSIDEGETESRQINVSSSTENVRVAAWWSDAPNGADLGHRQVDLALCKGTGSCILSNNPNSVFQQIIEPSITPGAWQIRVQSPPSSPFGGARTVHYFFYAEWPEWQCTI